MVSLIKGGTEAEFDVVAKAFDDMPVGQAKFNLTQPFAEMLGKVSSTEKVKKGVDMIVKFRDQIPEQYGITPIINNMLKGVITRKESAKNIAADKTPYQAQIDYIKGKIEGDRKGF